MQHLYIIQAPDKETRADVLSSIVKDGATDAEDRDDGRREVMPGRAREVADSCRNDDSTTDIHLKDKHVLAPDRLDRCSTHNAPQPIVDRLRKVNPDGEGLSSGWDASGLAV